MGSFPETCNDPLECYLLTLTKMELCNVAKFYSRLYGRSGGGGGGGTLVPLTIQTSVKCRVFVEQYLR